MLERELQEYLFANPVVLFPDEQVVEKSREVCIEGKRIDLLFRTEEASYIVELKAVPLNREHVGQVAEYYGLMRGANQRQKYKMILVSPLIPQFRRVLLEEIGIRCVEIREIPSGPQQVAPIQAATLAFRRRESKEDAAPSSEPLCIEEFLTCACKDSLATSHRLLRDTSIDVQEGYPEYVMVPIRMLNPSSADLICRNPDAEKLEFSRGGAWWAYAFGKTEEMPKNDIPNISAMGMPWSLDLAINAELQTSQSVMRKRITDDITAFNQIVSEHGDLQLQMILKLEHQPRFYYWIRLLAKDPGTWNGMTLIDFYNQQEREFESLRLHWSSRIATDSNSASAAQIAHMRSTNKRLNLAMRLVRAFPREDEVWALPYSDQCAKLVNECRRLKPLIGLFR